MGSSLQRGAPINRRRLAQILVAASLASPAWAQQAPMMFPFTLGVASGDPSPDGFAIWTRLAPQPLAPHGGMPLQRLPVKWEVASDERFQTIVQSGEVIARPEFAHAVHAECAGLAPHRPYWYRFICAGEMSPIGRAMTFPAAGAPIGRVRLAAAGCQNYEDGLYTAYGYLAAEDVDFVFHYGDYIYENGPYVRKEAWEAPMVRTHIGDECYTLDEYRLRYAQYKSDPNLKAAHAAAAWFMTYDDHEVSNNWAGAVDHFNSPPEAFALRRAMAWQAWTEHMPIRRAQSAALTGLQLYRRATYGNLLDANFLDTRQFRSDQPCNDGFKTVCDDVNKPDARMMSAEEENWLYQNLAAKKASWNLIAQQVMVLKLDRRGPKDGDAPILNMDSWAGYETPRQRLLKKLEAMALKNVVVLTGDEHQHYVNELRPRTGDPKSPIVAHEFVATSISSGGDGPGERPETATILSHNPDCKLIDDKRGYALCEVTPERWQTTLKTVDKVSIEGGKLSTLASFIVERGATGVKRA